MKLVPVFFSLVMLCAGAKHKPAPDPTPDFSYDTRKPIDLAEKGKEEREGVTIRDITFANLTGGRTAAYLVEPQGKGRHPGILFVHWFEPKSKNSNRTQFLDQAVSLAQDGVRSLLVETMWSDPEWFKTRKRSEDYQNSIQQVKELRRALDVLLAQPKMDTKRIAYVGHDFGMMYGAVLAGVDRRPTAWALQAGSTSFPDWFLFGPKMEKAAEKAFVEQMTPLDPIRYIYKASPSPVLLQFGKRDFYVTAEKANAFFLATREPKKVLYYDAGHDLNDQAIADRQEWLRQTLKLTSESK